VYCGHGPSECRNHEIPCSKEIIAFQSDNEWSLDRERTKQGSLVVAATAAGGKAGGGNLRDKESDFKKRTGRGEKVARHRRKGSCR
jgi:hypothetical protein